MVNIIRAQSCSAANGYVARLNGHFAWLYRDLGATKKTIMLVLSHIPILSMALCLWARIRWRLECEAGFMRTNARQIKDLFANMET